MIIYKQFSFDSAHYLTCVPEGHPCRQLHGHTYQLTISVEGKHLTEEGWIMDFKELKDIVKPLLAEVDHKLLNDVPGLPNPTSELLVKWFWNKLAPRINGLCRIELKETPTSGVIYEGE